MAGRGSEKLILKLITQTSATATATTIEVRTAHTTATADVAAAAAAKIATTEWREEKTSNVGRRRGGIVKIGVATVAGVDECTEKVYIILVHNIHT